MAYRGKTTCKILKDIRKQIAEANDIELVIKECTYQGDCLGTCPRCESEVAYLERELARREAMGKAVKVVGLAAASFAATACSLKPHQKSDLEEDTILMGDIEYVDSIEKGEGTTATEARKAFATDEEAEWIAGGKRLTDDDLQPQNASSQKNEQQPMNASSQKDEQQPKNASSQKNEQQPKNASSQKDERQPKKVGTPKNITAKAANERSQAEQSGEMLPTAGDAAFNEEIYEEEVEGMAPFIAVEDMPEFPGGMDSLVAFLSRNVKYPAVAQEEGKEGRSIVQFVVESDGSIGRVKVISSANDEQFDAEAVRVVKSMPNWKPGYQRGRAVPVMYILPINFRLK